MTREEIHEALMAQGLPITGFTETECTYGGKSALNSQRVVVDKAAQRLRFEMSLGRGDWRTVAEGAWEHVVRGHSGRLHIDNPVAAPSFTYTQRKDGWDVHLPGRCIVCGTITPDGDVWEVALYRQDGSWAVLKRKFRNAALAQRYLNFYDEVLIAKYALGQTDI